MGIRTVLNNLDTKAMRRIAIIGCGGAGKSTLARNLGEITNLPVYHLDSLYWQSGWVETPADQWNQTMLDLVARDAWIIDGNYGSAMDIRFERADIVIYLDYFTLTCLWHVIKRRIKYHGRTRPDMTEGCPEKIDLEFIRWIISFRRKRRPGIIEKLHGLSDTRIFLLQDPGTVANFLMKIKSDIEQI